MDTRITRILKELPEVGIYKNISPVLLELFPGVDKMDQHSVFSTWGIIYRILEEMKRREFIQVQQYPSMSGNQTHGYNWIDISPVMVASLQPGLDALEKELGKSIDQRIQDSLIETNQSTKEVNFATIANLKYQKKFSNRSLLLAGVSAFFIAITTYQQCNGKTDQKLQDLQEEVQRTTKSLDSLRFSLEEINSSIQSTSRDTVLTKVFAVPVKKNSK